MTRERWKKVEGVFEEALELPWDQRPAFLQRSCDGDEELRREVQSLLDSHALAGSFIDHPCLFNASDESERDEAMVANGQPIGSYRVLREIGRGGMGTVYLGERADEQYQKRVAIKLIKRGMDTDAVLRRFRNERQILASFDHANIARLFDAGTTATGLPYFVMEYVQGLSINEYCNAHGLSIHDRLKLFCEVCAAVAYAHRCGVIHRDIKSSNIVVTAEGVPKLVDFGIAKILQPAGGAETLLTTADLRPMTPQYASPEQVRGERLTPATDIYSLGVVLYELLTGQLPYRFVSQSPHDVARAITEQEPTRPSTAVATRDGNSKLEIRNSKSLKGDLDNIILKALRKEPEQRYHSVDQLSEDIRRYLEGRPIVARPVRAPARVWRWSRRNPILAGAASVCLVLALAVVWLLREQSAPKVAVPEKSIALLPFEYLGADKTDAYLADGIQEEILTRLSKVADLKVISRSSTQRYKSKRDNLQEIARQLGVANILEGTVQKAADQVRVNVQLIRAHNDSQLWAEKYDRKLTDIFTVESEVAANIANTLQARLTGTEQKAIAMHPTENSEAHELYLRGRFYWNQSLGVAFEKSFDKSREYYEKALQIDPNYALAYAGLADYYGFAWGFGLLPPVEKWVKAEDENAKKALELDPTLGEAYNPLAAVKLYYYRDWPGAERDFRRGLELSPNFAEMHAHYSMCLVFFGRNDEALSEAGRALALDPLSLRFGFTSGKLRFFMRQYDTAIEQYRKTLELDPNFPAAHENLGYAYEKKGMQKEAIAEWVNALTLTGEKEEAAMLQQTYAMSGFDAAVRKSAEKKLEGLNAKVARGEYVPAFDYAIAYVRTGEKEQAFVWLAKAVQERNRLAWEFRVDPLFDPLRSDPRFEKLANEIIASETPAPEKSIAVLPFKPLTQENRDPVFEMGLADTLITKLSNSRELIVPSLASIRKYGELDQDPVAAGRELKVDSVLEGNVQRSGDHIRITARLINVANGASLWADSFDEKFTDVFALEDAISQKVADALALQLTGKEKERLTKRYTENVEAYELYLTGRYHYAKLIPSEIKTAISFFQQAIEKDPNYALAYFGLAEANRSLAITSDVPSKDSMPQAKAAAMKAIEIDDSLAEAHASLSFSLIWYDWDWAGGEREAERAIALNPNSAMAHFAHAHVLSDLGRHEQAVAEQARAIQLEPVFLLLGALQGMYLYHARRDDQAIVQLEKTLQIDSDFWIAHLMLGKVYAQQKKYPDALAEFTKAEELSHGNSETIGSIGYVAALAGDKTRAASVLDELKSRSVQSYIPPCNVALVYDGLGDQNEAIRSLQKAVDDRDVRLTLLKVDPRWDSFRSNPQFLAVLKRIGLE